MVVKELRGTIDRDASFVARAETGPKSIKASRKAVCLFKGNFQAVFSMCRLRILESAMACPAMSKGMMGSNGCTSRMIYSNI